MTVTYKNHTETVLKDLRGAVRDGLDDALDLGLDEIERSVPILSGDLQSDFGKNRRRYTGDLGILATAPDTFYWRFIERGTFKLAATPFVEPALELVRRAIPAIFAKRMKQIR